MDIQVRGRGVPVSEMLHEYTTARIAVALDRFTRRLKRVEVVFTDLNGPRGGPAQASRLFIHLTDGRMLVVEARESDFYAALRRATEKGSYAVAQALGPRPHHRSRIRGSSPALVTA